MKAMIKIICRLYYSRIIVLKQKYSTTAPFWAERSSKRLQLRKGETTCSVLSQSHQSLYKIQCRWLASCKKPSAEDILKHTVYIPVRRNGVSYRLGVVDIGEPSNPVVLCSHGVPGGAEDFFNLLPSLLDLNLRIILPTYPGFGMSTVPEDILFKLDHSTVEKTELLKLVCKERQVKSVAMVLSHSQGTAAGYKFCAEEDVKSGVFLAPCGKIAQNTAQPYWLFLCFVGLLKTRIFRPTLSKYLLQQYQKIGFKEKNVLPLLSAVLTVASVDFPQNGVYVQTIRDKKLPVLLVVSQNDRIVDCEKPLDLLKHIHFPAENYVYYDKDMVQSNTTTTVMNKDWFARAVVFKKGGHSIHKIHTDVVFSYIKDLISFIKK